MTEYRHVAESFECVWRDAFGDQSCKKRACIVGGPPWPGSTDLWSGEAYCADHDPRRILDSPAPCGSGAHAPEPSGNDGATGTQEAKA